MARKSSDDSVGCLLVLLFLPIVLIFGLLKDFFSMCSNAGKQKTKSSVKPTQKTRVTKTTTTTHSQKKKEVYAAMSNRGNATKRANSSNVSVKKQSSASDDDLIGELTLLEMVTQNVNHLNKKADKFLSTHHCAKCGKDLHKCKCKGEPEIVEAVTEDDYPDYDWETHCEYCGELLEDCECDNKELSRQDISQDMDDLEFDEMNDVWDEMDQMEEDEEGFEEENDNLSFDNFSSFDDDDEDLF